MFRDSSHEVPDFVIQINRNIELCVRAVEFSTLGVCEIVFFFHGLLLFVLPYLTVVCLPAREDSYSYMTGIDLLERVMHHQKTAIRRDSQGYPSVFRLAVFLVIQGCRFRIAKHRCALLETDMMLLAVSPGFSPIPFEIILDHPSGALLLMIGILVQLARTTQPSKAWRNSFPTRTLGTS